VAEQYYLNIVFIKFLSNVLAFPEQNNVEGIVFCSGIITSLQFMIYLIALTKFGHKTLTEGEA
jgi:hypothetical protein